VKDEGEGGKEIGNEIENVFLYYFSSWICPPTLLAATVRRTVVASYVRTRHRFHRNSIYKYFRSYGSNGS
jgi:hypothetical protein